MRHRAVLTISAVLTLTAAWGHACEQNLLYGYLDLKGPVRQVDALVDGAVTITAFEPDGLSAIATRGLDSTFYTVDSVARTLTISYSSMQHKIIFRYDDSCRQVAHETVGGYSPNSTEYLYSSDGRERRTSPNSRGNVVAATLNEDGRMIASTTLEGGTSPASSRYEFQYNEYGDLVERQRFEGAFVVEGIRYEYHAYDDAGNWLVRSPHLWVSQSRSYVAAGRIEERVIVYY